MATPQAGTTFVYGAYDGHNLGDELILEALLQEVGVDKEEVAIISSRPDMCQKIHGVASVRAPDPKKLRLKVPELPKASSLVVGGGELIQEGKWKNPLLGLLAVVFLLAAQARRLRIPVFLWGVGVSQLHGPASRSMVRSIVNWSRCTYVRDLESLERLAEYGCDMSRVMLGADPVFNRRPLDRALSAHMVQDLGLAPGRYVLCCPAVDQRGTTKRDALTLARETVGYANSIRLDCVILFMDQRPSLDAAVADADLAEIDGSFSVVRFEEFPTALQVESVHRSALAVVSARMHSTIIATVQETPVLSVDRASKMRSNSIQLNLPHCDAAASVEDMRVELARFLDSLDAHTRDERAFARVRARAAQVGERYRCEYGA